MIKCTINGIEYRIQQNIKIEEHLGNRTLTEVTIRVDAQEIPIAGDIIRIYDETTRQVTTRVGEMTVREFIDNYSLVQNLTYDDMVTYNRTTITELFLGTCGLPTSPTYSTLTEPKDYQIKCRNANSILANRLVNTAEQQVTLTQLIRDLFNIYLQAEGMTLNVGDFDNIQINAYVAGDKPLDEVMNELAEVGNAVWNVSSSKVFSFLKREEFTSFPREINNSFVPFGRFKHQTKDLDLRTVQIVTGARETTSEQTEVSTYEVDQTEFTTVFPIAQQPRILINGTEVDRSRIGVNGLDSSDPNIAFFFSFRSNDITYVTNSNLLTAGDTVTIIYIGEFTIRTSVQDDARIAEIANTTGFSGRIERSVKNSSLRSTEDTQLFANSLLESFKNERNEISCYITSAHLSNLGYTISDFDVMTELTFNLPEINVSGNYVITERKISVESSENPLDNLRVDLKLKDRNLLRSYIESIKNINRDLRDISIREDDIIVQNLALPAESLTMSEEIDFQIQNAYYPVAAGVTDLTAPAHLSGTLGGVYPV